METSDAVIAGLAHLAIIPLLIVEIPAYRAGGYDGAFWKKPLDDKLDHIAGHTEQWTRLGGVWLPILTLAVAGLAAFSYQLAQAGAGTLAFLALGAYVVGALGWLIGVLLQTTVVKAAAGVRSTAGATPDWLEGFWNAGWWAEFLFVMAANLAAVVWGLAMLDSGYPADWMGWTAIVIGALAVLMVGYTREAFPHLGVIVPVVLGVALVLY